MGRFWASSSFQVRVTTQGAVICMRGMMAQAVAVPALRPECRHGRECAAAAARRPVAGRLHAPALAEEAAARAAGLARRGAAAAARAPCSTWPASEDVESRLVVQRVRRAGACVPGPLPRRALPPLTRPGWTLLVQGLDLHLAAAHEMLSRFRFVPDARLDDLMLSWASPGGGVGPHVDSYDVFLLQVQGRRRWRVGRVADTRLRRGRAAEAAAPLRAAARLAAGARRHALPAAALGPRRRGRGR